MPERAGADSVPLPTDSSWWNSWAPRESSTGNLDSEILSLRILGLRNDNTMSKPPSSQKPHSRLSRTPHLLVTKTTSFTARSLQILSLQTGRNSNSNSNYDNTNSSGNNNNNNTNNKLTIQTIHKHDNSSNNNNNNNDNDNTNNNNVYHYYQY